jgi:hypothetical protein
MHVIVYAYFENEYTYIINAITFSKRNRLQTWQLRTGRLMFRVKRVMV